MSKPMSLSKGNPIPRASIFALESLCPHILEINVQGSYDFFTSVILHMLNPVKTFHNVLLYIVDKSHDDKISPCLLAILVQAGPVIKTYQ